MISGSYVILDLKEPPLGFQIWKLFPVNSMEFIFFLSAASNFDCCLRYTKHIYPLKTFVRFTEQLADEACDINAIM